jgi:hypothetical protein
MSVSRKIHFNALPESVRRRWVELTAGWEQPGPLLVQPVFFPVQDFVVRALMGLLMFAVYWQADFGRLGEPLAVLPPPLGIAIYATPWFLFTHGVLGTLRALALRKGLPFAPGRYLFALHLVEAYGEVLKLWPLARCRATDHYRHTLLVLRCEGARPKTFTIDCRDTACVLQQLDASQRAVSDAARRIERGLGRAEDRATMFANDPFFEVRVSDGWAALARKPPPGARGDAMARPLPCYLAYPMAFALLASLVLGPPTWYVRNLLSEQAIWNEVLSATGSEPVQQYLDLGGRRVAEARALLEERELHEARGSVMALHEFVAKYPDNEHARQAAHALYAQAMAAFIGQANTADPRLVPFMDALLDHLEKTERAGVAVTFSRPDVALLKALDERLARKVRRKFRMEPVAPDFVGSAVERRERALVERLQQVLATVFPPDMLSLVRVEPLTEAAWEGSPPSIHVAYAIAPSGSLYRDASGTLAFAGIQVEFAVEMRVPGHPDVLSFELAVQPSSELVVEPWYLAFAELPPSPPWPPASPQPSDLVYQLMAARAFDHLSRHFGNVLFRVDGEAHRRAAESWRVTAWAAHPEHGANR